MPVRFRSGHEPKGRSVRAVCSAMRVRKKTAGKIPVRLNLLPLKSVCGRAAPTGYISPQKTGYEKRNDVQNTHLRRTPHGKPESDRHAGRLGTESAATWAAMTFIDLRDRYGITQLVVEEHSSAELLETASHLGREYVIRATGPRRRTGHPRTPRYRPAKSRWCSKASTC